MANLRKNIFAARAVGATKQIKPSQTLIYACANPGLMYALVYLMWAPFLYPGAHMVYAIGTVIQMFIIAGLYWLLSCSMPRSGGEYIYISRIIHPAIGLLSSFMISITAISWCGITQDWWLQWSLVDFFKGVSIINGYDPGWMAIADLFMITHVRAILGLISLGTVMLIYYKGVTWMVKVSTATLIMTIIGAATFMLATMTTGHDVFVNNWTHFTGLEYQEVINIAVANGHPTQFMIMPTIMAGSTYIILNTLGSTFGANLAGEVRDVQKSQLLSLFGSLAILMGVWSIFYGLCYANFGSIWTNCLMYLSGIGHDAYPFGSSEPFATLMVAILTGSPVFIFLIAIAFFVATYGSAAGLGFGPTRNFVAWANDRVFPSSFAKPNAKTKAPMVSVRAVICIAAFFFLLDVYAPAWTENIAYTIFTWFMAWIFLGISGLVFPYRRRVLFESSPPVVKTQVLGIPLVSVLGLFTTIISTAICIYMLVPFVRGDLPPTMVVLSFAIMGVCLIIYFISKSRNRAKGIELKYQFMEIPYQ